MIHRRDTESAEDAQRIQSLRPLYNRLEKLFKVQSYRVLLYQHQFSYQLLQGRTRASF
jgi:hypothetical protein